MADPRLIDELLLNVQLGFVKLLYKKDSILLFVFL